MSPASRFGEHTCALLSAAAGLVISLEIDAAVPASGPANLLADNRPSQDDNRRELRTHSLLGGWLLETRVRTMRDGSLVVEISARRPGDEREQARWRREFADARAYARGVGDFGLQVARDLNEIEALRNKEN